MNKVSIITINLNNKVGLEKTIKSVIAQTYTDYEFIVIDGASTDGSQDIIEHYKSKITYSISEPDTGIYNAMNKGIKMASGEYLHFLNSGDIYASESVLQKTFQDNLTISSFICGNYFFQYKEKCVKFDIYRDKNWIFSLYEIFADGLCHQAFFIKHTMFETYGLYDESLSIASDFKLFFIAIGIHHESVAYVDVDIVIYDTEGFSSNVGGRAILREKQFIAQQELPHSIYKRINDLLFLEQNEYMTRFIRSKKWIYNIFRGLNKICKN